MVDTRIWIQRKKAFWRRIWDDLEIGYLDKDLLPVLIQLNLDKNTYSLSSCSGRIVVVDSPFPWSRGSETTILFKKHVYVDNSELASVLSQTPVHSMWAIATGPILHVAVSSPAIAIKILKLARKAGFKHSGIMHYSRSKGYILELTTGVYLSQLLRKKDIAFCGENLDRLVETINDTLLEGKKRLEKLHSYLKEDFPVEIDEEIASDLEARGVKLDKTPLDIFNDLIKYRLKHLKSDLR